MDCLVKQHKDKCNTTMFVYWCRRGMELSNSFASYFKKAQKHAW